MLDVERNERGRGGADENLTTMIMGGFAEGGLRNGQEGSNMQRNGGQVNTIRVS
jgi:hypothetical protein